MAASTPWPPDHGFGVIFRGPGSKRPRWVCRTDEGRVREERAMTEPAENEQTERGAAEEASGAPLTETEVEVSKRPPSDPPETDGMGLGDADVE
jgi:hypothetical protein